MRDRSFPGGVWPVMLTPFTHGDEVDYAALGALVEWYIAAGVSGLFAVCQSSEMFFLTRREREAVARFVVDAVAGRVPVVASGHVSASPEAQAEELCAMADTGADAIILLTNRLAAPEEPDGVWLERLNWLLQRLPAGIPLGFYECPHPYKRLLGPPQLRACAETGRFFFLKDTCCDASRIRERLHVLEGSPMGLYNANATTLLQSLRDGAAGYSGVMANFHPELYVWLCAHATDPRAGRVADALAVFSLIERQCYPVSAKVHLGRRGLGILPRCRSVDAAAFTEPFGMEVDALARLADELAASLLEGNGRFR